MQGDVGARVFSGKFQCCGNAAERAVGLPRSAERRGGRTEQRGYPRYVFTKFRLQRGKFSCERRPFRGGENGRLHESAAHGMKDGVRSFRARENLHAATGSESFKHGSGRGHRAFFIVGVDKNAALVGTFRSGTQIVEGEGLSHARPFRTDEIGAAFGEVAGRSVPDRPAAGAP